MNTKELARKVRKQLKAEFPTYKFSITTEYNSIYCAVMVSDLEIEEDSVQINHMYAADHYEGTTGEKLQKIGDILMSEERTVSVDGDYGNIPNYYVNLSVGKWNKPHVRL